MSDKLKAALARGAKVEALAKLVEVEGLADLLTGFQQLLQEQRAAQVAQTSLLIAALDRLVDSIEEKEFENKEADLSEVVAAIKSLKQEPMSPHMPCDYAIDFERDQRGLMKPGTVRLISVPKMVN